MDSLVNIQVNINSIWLCGSYGWLEESILRLARNNDDFSAIKLIWANC